MAADERDEQYLLRIQDAKLAQRLTDLLRDNPDSKPGDGELRLTFDDDRKGVFTMGGDQFPVHVKDLPTLVESYKTYDDIHIVKSNDVGQMLLVPAPNAVVPSDDEARDGVTPAMRRARARHFRPKVNVPPAVVAHVEADLLNILAGGAPDNVEYLDQEEEYVIDKDGNGSWQPARPFAKPSQQARKKSGPRKQVGSGAPQKRGLHPRTKKQKSDSAAEAATPAAEAPIPASAASLSGAAAPEIEEI